MISPLFGAPGSRRPLAMDERKQQAFSELKAICVPLLAAARLPQSPNATRQLLDLLTKLQAALAAVADVVFTPALANYAFFPLSSLLQPPSRGDAVLESVMHALSVLIRKWRTSSAGKGMDEKIRTELWIMVALQLGGPLDPAAPGKGKGKEKEQDRADETKAAMVEALLELMGPPKEAQADPAEEDSDDDDPLGARIDWTADEPSPFPPSSKAQAPPIPAVLAAPPIPILFHSLTTLLSLAASPTSLVKLQLDSLTALRFLVHHYLSVHPPSSSASADGPPAAPSGPSPLLATALPGTASTLSRISLSLASTSAVTSTESQRRQPSTVVVAALTTLAELLVGAVGDEVTGGLRKAAEVSEKGGATLEELVESFQSPAAMDVEQPETTSDLPTSTAAPPQPPPLTGPTLPTPAWLTYTLGSITSLFASLSPLALHDSPLVRGALVELLSKVLREAGTTLEDRREIVIEGLLVLAGDDWDEVGGKARSALHSALVVPSEPSNASMIVTIVRTKLLSLPSHIRRQDESSITRSSRVVRVALDLLSSSSTSTPLLGGMALEKWSFSLLAACEFERIAGAGGGEDKGMSLAWLEGGASLDGQGGSRKWPTLKLKNVGDAAARQELDKLWSAVGRSAGAGGKEGEVVDFFLGVAAGSKWEPRGVAAMWVLDGVLQGLVNPQEEAEGRKMGKARKKVIRGVVKTILSLLEGLEEDRPEDQPSTSHSAPEEDSTNIATLTDDPASVISVEHQRGVTHTAGLDALKPVASASTRRTSLASHRILLLCFALRILSTSAALLTSSFQPHLLQVLYHVLAHLSPSSHPLLRAHAQIALDRISFSTSFASAQNLVLANVDYVVNSVSQRLSVARLDPAAPLVLVEMIRLVGQPIVPMVQDLVEDVLEALDDYHGYEEVTVGLWAVLDALMKVMEEEEVDKFDRDAPRPNTGPDAQADWTTFVQWFDTRHEPAPSMDIDPLAEEDDSQPKENPRQPFKSSAPLEEEGEGVEGGTKFPSSEAEVPATRPQAVAASILAKALYFLSHSSPFLRSRVLSLIASAVPLLAPPPPASADSQATSHTAPNRQSDLLPVIHRAWPFILLRLADPEPYVVLAACDLLEALATFCGSFLSRRILEDVWPRFRTLLARQAELDRGSAVAGKTKYSTSHRAYRAVLGTMRRVASDVPLKEDVTWEMALLFRRFLLRGVQIELADEAEKLYMELARKTPDSVWLALGGAGEQEGVTIFLRLAGLQEARVNRIMAGL